eukprot:gnl/Carplike_NY0171/6092_a8362_288.p1 GENE.gnl/Carplike_NY0171/6092_a8362_288~~gnl/Carplike_NY0171/6092_a8362_288.p1  ORF type:complete len:308 (-),score=23.72 gnl/Carplike_NY0171/6092_a8362_288:190-1113(-)
MELIDSVIKKLSEVKFSRPNKTVVIPEDHIKIILDKSIESFSSQPVLLDKLSTPLRIFGDIHGQYADLLRLFEFTGTPGTIPMNFLFLGDYVDRGYGQFECILLLLCYKIKYSDSIFLLRGNHETANVNKHYGFYQACIAKYNIAMWRKFCDCFDWMPLAAVIDEKIFCTHGGLSPSLTEVSEIELAMKRPLDIGESGMLSDLLWADPSAITGWAENNRGVSYIFGNDVVDTFLENNKFELICRAHQVVEDGYEFFADRKLVTIFSAPNYMNSYNNGAAVMTIEKDLKCSFQVLKPVHRSFDIDVSW